MKLLVTLTVAVMLVACDAIFEDDLTLRTVEVISPVNHTVTQAGDVVFLWREVPDADSYRLTIVSPTFSNANRVIADTVIDSLLQYTIPMQLGEYQWSIIASNSAYSTPQRIMNLTVE